VVCSSCMLFSSLINLCEPSFKATDCTIRLAYRRTTGCTLHILLPQKATIFLLQWWELFQFTTALSSTTWHEYTSVSISKQSIGTKIRRPSADHSRSQSDSDITRQVTFHSKAIISQCSHDHFAIRIWPVIAKKSMTHGTDISQSLQKATAYCTVE